jgi:hypothetical protein
MAMVDELLPPDPSKDGWYWVSVLGFQIAAVWVSSTGWWMQLTDGKHMTSRAAWLSGYRLASPHPIPGPEELEELYRDAATTVAFRAALGTKP